MVTCLALADQEVVGFNTLVVGKVDADAFERLTKGPARHPIPLMLLAHIGVASAWQGRRLGAGFLKDAML
jgi:hypothetical protein